MNCYQNMINRVTDIICENISAKRNYILIGDNSSGKSDILRMVMENKLGQAVYFIDSVNRTFDANKVEFYSKSYQYASFDPECVISQRIMPFNYNLQDTFKAAGCIEQLYDKYSESIISMCQAFLKKQIQIVREEIGAGLMENKVLIDGEEMKLSSGYQAIIRLFSELLYFCDVLKIQKWENGFVIIDELDEYLSPKYSARILNFLQDQFPHFNFLISTHSIDLVNNTKDIILIVLKGLTYQLYSMNEIKSKVSAEDIFADLFFQDKMVHVSNNDGVDDELRRLLNLKIAGIWDVKAENELRQIKYKDILPHQQMIYKQIEEW